MGAGLGAGAGVGAGVGVGVGVGEGVGVGAEPVPALAEGEVVVDKSEDFMPRAPPQPATTNVVNKTM